MDEEDFRALIDVLAQELRDVGADDIADEGHYVIDDPDAGEPRLLEPRERLVEMLMALDRFLAIQDRSTYDQAMTRLNEMLPGHRPDGAHVDLTAGSREINPINLAAAPDLSDVRRNVTAFVQTIMTSEGGSEEGTDE